MEDQDLMRRALEKVGQAPAPRKSRQEVRAERGVLLPREREFVRVYLETGSQLRAAQAAGYKAPGQAAQKVLRRPVVVAAIARALERSETALLTKANVIEEAQRVMREGRPFERLKALELIARLQGYMAPTKSVHEYRSVGVSPYAELVATLRESGATFSQQEREALRQQLVSDAAAISEALALLGGYPGGASH